MSVHTGERGMWWLWTTVTAASTLIVRRHTTGSWLENTRKLLLRDTISILEEIPKDNEVYEYIVLVKDLLEDRGEFTAVESNKLGKVCRMLTDNIELMLAGEFDD